MREAKSLGIPLRQPGTGRPPARRCSVSHLTDNDGAPADSCNVWSCSHCHRTVVEKPRSLKTAPDTAPVLHKTASPFKDMFRVANLFGRKDSRSKVAAKQTLTLPRGYVARCEGCDQPEVTSSSPCSRRRAEMAESVGVSGQGHSKVKYRRSASTPRPGHTGDAKLQVHSASESTASKPARRTHGQSASLSLCLSVSLCVCACVSAVFEFIRSSVTYHAVNETGYTAAVDGVA